jgi:hypothetical protein
MAQAFFERLQRSVGQPSRAGAGAGAEDALEGAGQPDLLELSLHQIEISGQRSSAAPLWREEVEAPRERWEGQNTHPDGPFRPWDADPNHASGGWMFGMPPVYMLLEELRRAAFAQAWLIDAQIVRSSPVSIGKDSKFMLSLIHDGYGTALERLTDPSPYDDPEEAIHALTAVRGELDWKSRPAQELASRILVNLRWRECQIRANFNDITFVNCDFRGSRFEECGFLGVVFINCLLDNATFEDCSVEGEPQGVVLPREDSSDSGERKRKPYPSFESRCLRPSLMSLLHYRQSAVVGSNLPSDISDGDFRLFSKTSGVPAVPMRSGDRPSHETSGPGGGLVMYGGRLSSLMFKNCAVGAGALVALRFIAGSSLDIVDTASCRLEISVSAIRGLTVTQPVIRKGVAKLDLTAYDCYLTNAWLGDGWEGAVRVTLCKCCNCST